MLDESAERSPRDARLKASLDLFSEVCDLPTAERDRVLAERCAGDGELRAAVERLLGRDSTDGGPNSDVGTGAGARVAVELVQRRDHFAVPLLKGRYRILRVVGEGGMGTVYEAEQTSPRRRVALKSLRDTALGSEQALRRFALEADVLAQLQHPAIAQVFEAGFGNEEGGPAWIAMELVRGQPLTTAARERGLDLRARLELFLDVCDAVTFAHQKGVIHRDLKPGNILVSEPSSDLPTGQVKILDFGVARVVGGGWAHVTSLTGPGQLIGTLPYMSPEQVAGEPEAIDTRTDVYALGVILCELLADRRPLELKGRGSSEAMRVVREEEPPPPSAIAPVGMRPALRGDLDAIVLKALAKDPMRRYQSVALLAEDVRAHLRGEPVSARGASTWYLLTRRARRYRVPVASGLLFAIAILAFGIRASIDAEHANGLALEAQAAERAAEVARAALASELSVARLEQARLLSARGNLAAAIDIVREEASRREDARLRWVFRDIAARHACIEAWEPHVGPVRVVGFLADATLVLSAGEDGRAILSDLGGHTLACQELGQPITAGDIDRSNDTLVVGLPDGRVTVLDGWTLEVEAVHFAGPSAVRSVSSIDGLLAWGSADGTVTVRTSDGAQRTIARRPRSVGGLVLLDRDILLAGDDGGEVVRIDLATGESRVLARHEGPVTTLDVDRERRRCFSGSTDRVVRVIDFAGPEVEVRSFDGGNGTIHAVGSDRATGDLFVSGWWTLDRWDRTLVARRQLAAPPTGPLEVDFASDLGLAVSSHPDGSLRLWFVQTAGINGGGALVGGLAGRSTVAVSRDGRLMASADAEGEVVVSDVATGAVLAHPPPHAGRVRSLAFDPTGSLVASAGDDGVLTLSFATSGVPVARVTGVTSQTGGAIGFSPDGRLLAAAWRDRSVRLLAVPDLTSVASLPLGDRDALSVSWSPDGRTLATTARDNRLRLWSSEGELLHTLDCLDTPWTTAFSPDGTSLAVGSWSRRVDLYDTSTLSRRRSLSGAAGLVTSVAWLPAPSGTGGAPEVIASALDGMLRVWDTRDGRSLFEFAPFAEGEVIACAVDEAGSVLAASGSHGEAAAWDLRRWDDWAGRGIGLPGARSP